MKTPVIIPAYKAEKTLAATLRGLPAEDTDPLVVVNGPDNGAGEIANQYGARLVHIERRGKLPAIQEGIRALGHQALDPVLLLDADSRPVFREAWHSSMVKSLQPNSDRPAFVAGAAIFTVNPESSHSSRGSAVARSLYRVAHGSITRVFNLDPAYYGPNQAFKLANDDVYERVMTLPNIWPKEDVAMARAIVEDDGIMRQLVTLRSAVLTPESAAFAPLRDYIFRSSEVEATASAAYRADVPDDSVEYDG